MENVVLSGLEIATIVVGSVYFLAVIIALLRMLIDGWTSMGLIIFIIVPFFPVAIDMMSLAGTSDVDYHPSLWCIYASVFLAFVCSFFALGGIFVSKHSGNETKATIFFLSLLVGSSLVSFAIVSAVVTESIIGSIIMVVVSLLLVAFFIWFMRGMILQILKAEKEKVE